MQKLFLSLFSFFILSFATAQNLVTNGNFSSGNTGFTTGYILDCTVGGAIGEQRYCVGTNPNAVHVAWAGCGDHTTGTGNMMILNGTSATNVIVWQQTPVTVMPNTCYTFCVWATSVYPDNPGKIKLIVNGATQAFTQLSSTTCAWQQICGTWNSGSATSATLTIIDEDLNPGGNDLAIDDISFTAIATPCSITLPLRWNYLKSEAQNSGNVIEWGVDNVINNDYFIVEKSTNGIKFDALKTIANTPVNTYTYIDNSLSNEEVIYYRIKQVDTDGRYSYSAITKVINKIKVNILTLVQNPVFDFAKVKINAKKGSYSIQIFNTLGINIYQEKIILSSDYLEKFIATQNLKSGMYFIKLINSQNENIGSLKFLKN